MWTKKPTDECVFFFFGDMMYLFIYLFIFCCYWCFLNRFFFLHLHTPDAWWTLSEVAAVEADISGVSGWSFFLPPKCLVRSEVSLLSAWLMNGFKWRKKKKRRQRNKLFCFLSFFYKTVPAKSSLSCFDLPCCCSVGGKKKKRWRNDLTVFMKNAWHSLFHVARERRPDSFTNRVHTFLFAWVASDLFWHIVENWSFLFFLTTATFFRTVLKHIITLSMKKWLRLCGILCFFFRFSGNSEV